ncbi:MAG: hypothetical protein LBE56_07220 [Tannerella sp.]|jgi:hypothetical protein|nr:hypothetical protein [Tannerella sp.]
MRKILLSALIVVASVYSIYAQEENFTKGTVLVNASTTSLGLIIESISDYSTTELNLGAGVGFFIIDNLSINAKLGVNYFKAEGDDDATSRVDFRAGARYYFMQGMFGGAGISVRKINGYDDLLTYADIEGGYTHFLNDRWYIEPALQVKVGVGDTSGTTVGIVATIGVRF